MFTTAAAELWKYNQSAGRAVYGDDFTRCDGLGTWMVMVGGVENCVRL